MHVNLVTFLNEVSSYYIFKKPKLKSSAWGFYGISMKL